MPLIPQSTPLECKQRFDQQEYQKHVHIMPRGLQRGTKDGPGPQKAWYSAEGVDPLQASNSTELCSANLGTRTELLSSTWESLRTWLRASGWTDTCGGVRGTQKQLCPAGGDMRPPHRRDGFDTEGWRGVFQVPLTRGWAIGNFSQPNEKICCLSLPSVLPFFE